MTKLNKSFILFLHLLLLQVVISGFVCAQGEKESIGWNQLDAILKNINPPSFPDKEFNIISYNAVGDGKTDCTIAFKNAIEDCAKNGGGKVVVPEGTFLTGAIHLKSNVNLYISENGVVKFSTDKNNYLPAVFTRWEGVECMNYSPLIYAYEEENIAITGKGILDGQGGKENPWWSWKGKEDYDWKKGMPNQKESRDELFKMADDNIPPDERIFGDGHYLRPNFIQPYKCKNILIEGITIKDSPMWFIHPVLCENVSIINITVEGLGPNNDGCDPESSKNVLIKGCYFNTGDDCIAIKSGRNTDGRRINIPSENIVIQDCIMKEGHGGVVMGSEISGGVRNVFAENCQMSSPNLERAIRIKTNSVRSGTIENIFIRNVSVGEVSDAVLKIDFFYEEGDAGKFTPVLRNINIENLTSEKSPYAIWIKAYDRSPVQNIELKDCTFNNVEKDNLLENVESLKIESVNINGKKLTFKPKHDSFSPKEIDEKWSHRLIENFINLHPDTVAYKTEAKSYKWNYEQGLILEAFYQEWKASEDDKYFHYIKKNIDYYVQEDGSIKTYKMDDFNCDNIAPGRILLYLYKETGEEKYKKAADTLRKQLELHPRTSEGGFWHKKIYPYQMWLDGLYMVEPFYTQYSVMFNKPEAFNDIAKQFLLTEKHLKDEKTGLYFHGWDESKEQKWANPETGASPNFWGRAMGWFMMALVDVLDYFPLDHPNRSDLIRILQNLSKSLIQFRDDKTGLWYQVVDKGNKNGNYIEASASSMYTYAFAKGFNKGYLDKKYLNLAKESFQSIIKNLITIEGDGIIHLNNVCSVGGLGGNPYRDGSFEYYINEPNRVNDFKGYGSLMLATIELESDPNSYGLKSDERKTVTLDYYFNNEWKDGKRYHYIWEDTTFSGFSELGKIIQGLDAGITSLTSSPTKEFLSKSDIYIIVDPDTPKETEKPNYIDKKSIEIISDWVNNGGILVLMANDSGNCEFENLNKLSGKFGITFNNVSESRVTGNNFDMGKFNNLPSHPVFNNVKQIYLKEISTLKLSGDTKPILQNNDKIIMAIAKYGKGYVFAVGDPWLYNEYIDNRKLPSGFENFKAAKNLFKWLLYDLQ